MDEIKLKARAKINITLDILSRRDNGYHDVEMIMQTINLYDDLTFRKTNDDTIKIKTNLPYLPTDNRNLVYQIIEYMKQEYGISKGVSAYLYKRIPVAAGLAGGSSNGAQTILGMNQLFDLELSMDAMLTIGQRFGSDIPYCMLQGSALATGLGETLTLLDPFPKTNILIIKPKFGLSTATVYKNYTFDTGIIHPETKKVVDAIKVRDIDYICSHLVNVLERVAINLYPEIKGIKEQMKQLGANGVLMSGSGPTVYGIFKDKQQAEKAKDSFKRTKQMQYVYLTSIYNRKRG